MTHYTTKTLILNEVERTCTVHLGRHVEQVIAGLVHVNRDDALNAIASLRADQRITLRDGKLYQRR